LADRRPLNTPSDDPTSGADASGADAHGSAADAAALMAEDVEIDHELKGRILALHGDLERLDHYALLGVDRSADKKVLKRAYYELAAAFHPDRYFRKRLGSFKARMEAIFSRLTLAHETLADKDRRAEYDGYLRERSRARGIEDLLADALAEVQRAEAKVESEAGAMPPAAPAPTPPAAPVAVARAPGPSVDAAARREALARRLLGGRAPAASARQGGPPATPPGHPPVQTAAEAMGALRRRYEDRMLQARNAQARKYADRATAALAEGDAVGAANALRVASTLAPTDDELQKRAAAAQTEADAILGETYTKQAQYEEKNGQWTEAARSWGRACRGRPNDAHTHERAANALLKASGDLHDAVKLAKRACELEPQSAVARTTLGASYLAAGMVLNARRELETAAQLAPHDGTIRALMEKVGAPT
jgi:curved DNA-binding protein CbpA